MSSFLKMIVIVGALVIFEEPRVNVLSPKMSLIDEVSHKHVQYDAAKTLPNQPPNEETTMNEDTHQVDLGTSRRSQRHNRLTIPYGYIMWLQEHKFDIDIEENLVMFLQTIENKNSI